MFEIIFKNDMNNSSKTIRVIADDFDTAFKKCKDAGYDSSFYNQWGTEDIVSFKKVDHPNVEIIS